MVKKIRLAVMVAVVFIIATFTVSGCNMNEPIDVLYIEDIYTENDTGSWVLITGNATVGSSGEGVSDHGDLIGLDDDDHSLYATNTELSNHSSATTGVHGTDTTIVDSNDVALMLGNHTAYDSEVHGIEFGDTVAGLSDITSSISTHESDTSTHGVAEVAGIADVTSGVASGISTHSALTDTHG